MAPPAVISLISDDEDEWEPSASRAKYAGAVAATAAAKRAKAPAGAPVASTSKPIAGPSEPLPSRAELEADRLARQLKREREDGPIAGPSSIKRAKTGAAISTPSSAPPFLGGRLCITRTRGRMNEPNTVLIEDIIQPQALRSMFSFSFFIAEPEYFPLLPIGSNARAGVRVIVGRDAFLDPFSLACAKDVDVQLDQAGKWDKSMHFRVTRALSAAYAKEHKGLEAVYAPWINFGCSHSKIHIIEYPTFLRVAVSSAESSDNQWYIADLPIILEGQTLSGAKAARPRSDLGDEFERMLFKHAAHLGCPKDYLDGLRGRFDFSATKVRLVPSVNGSFSGAEGKEYGLLRLRELAVQHFKAHPGLIGAIEVCTASVGNLQTTQLVRNMTAALQGGPGGPAVNFKVVYPSEAQVDRMHKRSELVLPVETCCSTSFKNAGPAVKTLFHKYESKDAGHLLHMKHVIAWRSGHADTSTPEFMLIGSANFSQAAFGQPNAALTTIRCSNDELGVWVAGSDLPALLAPRSTWTSIVPYKREAVQPYGSSDVPWSWPAYAAKQGLRATGMDGDDLADWQT